MHPSQTPAPIEAQETLLRPDDVERLSGLPYDLYQSDVWMVKTDLMEPTQVETSEGLYLFVPHVNAREESLALFLALA